MVNQVARRPKVAANPEPEPPPPPGFFAGCQTVSRSSQALALANALTPLRGAECSSWPNHSCGMDLIWFPLVFCAVSLGFHGFKQCAYLDFGLRHKKVAGFDLVSVGSVWFQVRGRGHVPSTKTPRAVSPFLEGIPQRSPPHVGGFIWVWAKMEPPQQTAGCSPGLYLPGPTAIWFPLALCVVSLGFHGFKECVYLILV